ncbi:MAG: prepilin-type N-terminal cleavage/methylation domain-containing protein, partial [Oscillospiraceae bacterium]
MKKTRKSKKGFTLVELMVVVAILGVLVAVAIPVYNGVTEKAEM